MNHVTSSEYGISIMQQLMANRNMNRIGVSANLPRYGLHDIPSGSIT